MIELSLSEDVQQIGLGDVYTAHAADLPKRASAEAEEEVRRDILDLLHNTELINLSTMCPSGWTATHCMHFCTVDGPGGRPIIYMSTKHKTRKVANVGANPRVSLSAYRALGFEERRKSCAAQLQAVCVVVENPEELAFALDQMRKKAGYGFTTLLDLEGQAMLRAEVVFAAWQDNQRKPQRCTIDYRTSLTERAVPIAEQSA